MIEAEEGRHFDPAVVAAFRAAYPRFLAFLEASHGREGELVTAELSASARC